MDKLAANITKGGTFLFRTPADGEPITKRQIIDNLAIWIIDPRDAYEYVTLLQVDRFVLTKEDNTTNIYADDDEQPEEISQEDAKRLYGLMSKLIAERETKKRNTITKSK